ncbi:MAG: asparagine synthase (glutamine-hydrolyzing), partial [Eggerthellaceae bacterium]|nr:asparagine synthase (glutamine-hydrolyzing) [Eggerthellaceae bacterium]
MCGFAGFVVTDALRATSDPQRVAERMGDRIKHRGPDDAAYYIDERVALAFRRLSIIDLEGGRQPIESEDGSCVLVLNGEIYNYRELRAELVKRGHVFKTHADSEVVLHGFEEYGRAVLDRLRGMFAFVIWDKRNDVLFGARDIFGIKPLYCYQRGGEFMFASEIKSFLAHPRFLCELERAHIATYLSYEYIPNEQTLFKSVQKVLPAHWFEWDVRTKSFSTGCYYEMRYRVDERLTLDEWAQRIDEALSESVAAHLVSDVEVGGFLSSGVDSSYLVERVLHAGGAEGAGASGVGAAAAEGASAVGAAGVGGAKAGGLRTFSVGYADERFSELPAAQRLARELGVECVANTVSADEFFGAMPAIQYHMDEPLPNPSENPLYFLCENAARQVKVVLSGEGADELFGGYPNYSQECATAAYERCVPRFLRRLAGAAAGGLPSFKGQHFLVRGAVEPWQRNSRANYVFEESECRRFLRSSAET